jgi:hypothetical protein
MPPVQPPRSGGHTVFVRHGATVSHQADADPRNGGEITQQ